MQQGVTASAFSLVVNHFVTQNPFYAAHGASGATYGAISFFACAFPRTTFLLFFVVPVPAWLCVSGIFAWDVYNGLWRRGGMTDSAGRASLSLSLSRSFRPPSSPLSPSSPPRGQERLEDVDPGGAKR